MWVLIVAVLRHELRAQRAQRAEWAELDAWDRFCDEMERTP